jgi:hypothetical protein
MPGQLGEHVLEHGRYVGVGIGLERAEPLRFLLRSANLGVELIELRLVALLVPLAERDQMLLQPLDGVAERPRLAGAFRTIRGRIVRGGMALDTIGEELDQGRTEIRASAVGGPTRDRVDGERVVSVDAQRRDAVAQPLRREGGQLAPAIPEKLEIAH